MTPRVLLFDFDGTIADTAATMVEIYNTIAVQDGYRTIDARTLVGLRNQSARDAIRSLGIPLFQMPFVLARLRRGLHARIHTVRVIDGMPPVLDDLKARGYRLAIVTSNSSDNVRQFLDGNAIRAIDDVHADHNLFRKHRVIARLMRERGWSPDDLVYVGDESRDVEMARRCGIRIISVTWGYNTRELLADAKPDALIDRPSDLTDVLA